MFVYLKKSNTFARVFYNKTKNDCEVKRRISF